MHSFKYTVAAICSLVTTVVGHGFVTGWVTDGKWNQGFLLDYYYQKVNTGSFPSIAAWYAEDLDSGFVEPNSFGTPDIVCHKNAQNAPLTGTVKAGGSVTAQWNGWPHNLGPVLNYVAACNGDCATIDKTTLKWVKIDQYGIDYATQVWGAGKLMAQNNTWTSQIPASLKSGNYVFRHEIIAAHGAGSANGAQAYPQCFNIAITGGGSATPTGTLGTALYKADDPGILFNPYTTITSYAMPGPTLWTG